ncbi:MAG TPA: tetratricopeptide repeat protein [Woeseiaceae bacterium]|nr:tetratricopeptide repeat protein [Woeseiaceae bacterium]
MNRDKKFWSLLLVFQVFFGLVVFAVTREYYVPDTAVPRGHALTAAPAATGWSRGMTATDVARLTSPGLVDTPPTDPAEIYRRAEEFFAARQYAQAAQLYEQLLQFSPDDAEIHNNLGLTLFYLGRGDEALARLNEGAAKDPAHQRIWLTLGYVNSQLGNIQQAREALTKAAETGGNASISEAALEMLAKLP